jgi:hypothetical protein
LHTRAERKREVLEVSQGIPNACSNPAGSRNRGLLSLMRRHADKLSRAQKAKLAQYFEHNPAASIPYQQREQICQLLLLRQRTVRACRRLAPALLTHIQQLRTCGFAPLQSALLTSSGRPGFYFRVFQEGEVGADDAIMKIGEAKERMTVAEINILLYSPNHSRDQLERALRIEGLSPGWRTSFEALLQSQTSGTRGSRRQQPRIRRRQDFSRSGDGSRTGVR